jgi:tetratricopeptide (TPR) repeat protein
LVLAILLAYLLHTASSTWRLRDAARQEAPIRVVALISLMSLLVVGSAGFPLHLAPTGALFAVCLAMLASSDARLGIQTAFFAGEISWRRAYGQAALLATVACLAIAAFITVQAARVEYKLIHAIHIANGLMRGIPSVPQARTARKAEMLANIREGIAINPHYRKVTAELAEPLAASGDWASATWILESVVASRPHVVALWTGLAMGYSQLGQHERAQAALEQVRRLKPDAVTTRTLEVILLSRAGHLDQAIEKINRNFDNGTYDFDMVQAAYAIGYQTQNWSLAIRSQELIVATWPDHAADGYFRLGLIYSNSAVHDDAKALAAFKAGLNQVQPHQQATYRQQVPQEFRGRM